MFGPHLIMEANGCSYDKLNNEKLLTDLLDQLPEKMNMTKIMAPYVFEYKGGVEPDDWGLSGIVIIAESHLAFHTFPDKGFLTVDIFSCKDFDVAHAVSEIVKVFEPETWDQQLIQRGREFPKSMTRAKLVLDNERTQFSQLAYAS
ncbi:MAG: adenosylmethionine decarboxylase [Candidatus Melainabacteria bacterium]|nr:adenosylmethionine decarboxylase [Candidatus Melainabacteria bacterium]